MAYTWSKALGDFLDHLSAGGGAVGNNPSSAYAMEKDYGLLAFDIPHRLVTSFIYELPFGDGRRFQPDGRARRHCQRLVGERHSDAERRPAIHGDDNRSGAARDQAASRARTAWATRCRRLEPDARFAGWIRRRSRRRR